MDKETRSLIRHNAIQVAKLIEFTDASQRGTAGSYFNVEVVKKKASKSPHSAFAEKFWSDKENVHATTLLTPLLHQLQKQSPSLYVPFYLVERNPTLLRNWRKEQTPHEQRMLKRFNTLCQLVATRLHKRTRHRLEPVRLFVNVNPDDEESESPIHFRNKKNNEARTHTAHDSYRRLTAEIEAVMKENQCTQKAAIGLFRDRLEREKKPDVSPRTIKTALSFVKRERAGLPPIQYKEGVWREIPDGDVA